MAVLFTVDWMSSREGFMLTTGTVSSTSTSKKGLSTKRNPADIPAASLFFRTFKDLCVADRMAWYMSLA